MGKRNREVQQSGRRRPMLQLGGSSKKSNVMSRNTAKLEPITKAEPPIDDKSKDELAGFLAEINSLEDPPEVNSKPATTAQSEIPTAKSNVSLLYDPANFDPSTQGHLLPQPWEACYDESTGYYYYWNTMTNEVQWYPPVATLPPPPPPDEPMEEMNESRGNVSSAGTSDGTLKTDVKIDKISQKTVSEDQEISNTSTVNGSPKRQSIYDNLVPEYSSSSPKDQEILETDPIQQLSADKSDEIESKQETEVKIEAVQGYADSPEHNDETEDVKMEPTEQVDTDEEKKKIDTKEQSRLEADEIARREEEEKKQKEKEEKEQERLEMERLHKEALLQKEREALLRAKLSRKKKEREEAEKRLIIEREKLMMKEAAARAEAEEENSQKSLNDSYVAADGEKNETEDFSMDMFSANDDNTANGQKTSKKSLDSNMSEINQVPPEKKQQGKSAASLKVTPKVGASKQKSSPKRFPKGSWRIIDAGYDDEGTSDDEDSKPISVPPIKDKLPMPPPDEDKPPIPPIDYKPPMPSEDDRPPLPPGPPDMDDYADMLLEDVSKKDISRDVPTKHRQKEDLRKKKKKKKEHDPPLPPPLPPPQPERRGASSPPPPQPPSDDYAPPPPPPPPPLPEEDRPPVPTHSPDKEKEILAKIDQISTLVAEKLRILDVTRDNIKDLHVYLIELEIRMEDWRKGALETKYLLSKLEELDSKMMQFEETAAPSGWLCHWSKDFHMYYYYNTLTGESQWDYPNAVVPPPPPSDQHIEHPLTTSKDSTLHRMDTEETPNQIFPISQGESIAEQLLSARATLTESATTASAPLLVSATKSSIPLVRGDKEAPGLDTDSMISKKATADPYRDPYRLVKKKKIQEASRLQDSPAHSPSRNDSEPETQSPLQSGNIIAAAPLILSQENTSSPLAQDLDALRGGNSPLRNEMSELLPSKAKVKRKKVATSGLASKKLKQVSSLVQKWQTVKQKAEEEEQVEDDYEEDQEVLSERRIEEWKQEVQESGAANYNPNFETIKGDWRERLKRKTES